MRFRALALVFSLACLLAAPRMFAEKHDQDKDSGKKPAQKKSTEKPPAPPQHQPAPQANQHGSSGQGQPHSASGSSGSGSSSSTHEHSGTSQGSGEHAHHTPATTSTAAPVHDAGSKEHHPAYHPNEAHGVRETAHAGHTQVQGTHVHEHIVVNREHLHERMLVRPDTEARHHAYERYRAERVQFQHHAAPVHFLPVHRVVLTKIRIVPTTYHYRRTVFYDEYSWQAPVYVYSMYPRYGLWDATFLMFALDHIAEEQYALMFYHHQREEDMKRWMADSERLAADNQELRDKLDAMKVQMAKLDETGLENDPSYVPPDAQDVALSPEVIEKLTSSN
jgi:hypothetical protein